MCQSNVKAAKSIVTALVALLALEVVAAEFFVSTNGTAQGDGSKLLPWDLVTALGSNTATQNVNNVVKPGDTIWLRGGKYGTGSNWVITSKLIGTSNQPIVLRQYPGERAIIDGGISALGAWSTFWGFEIMNSSTNRSVVSADRPPGVNLLGPGHRCINLIIHDVGHPGIGHWKDVGDGGEIYGCLLWNNGIYSLDPGWNGAPRGSAIYAQNNSGSRYITDTISFKNFTSGMKAYAEAAYAEGFHFDGNVVFENQGEGILVESVNNPITNAVLTGNVSYNNGLFRAGLYGANHKSLLLSGNYFVSKALGTYNYSTSFKGWRNLTMTNNTFVELSTESSYAQTAVFSEIVRTNMVDTNITRLTLDANRYYGNGFGTNYDNWRLDGARKTFAKVQSLGYEASGRFILTTPKQNDVILRANRYERGRAHLVVLNWLTNSSVSVDISGVGLLPGEAFELRDVQNYLGTPALRAIYDSARPTISVPLNHTNCAQMIGEQHHYRQDPNLHTETIFNAFVILLSQRPAPPAPATDLRILDNP